MLVQFLVFTLPCCRKRVFIFYVNLLRCQQRLRQLHLPVGPPDHRPLVGHGRLTVGKQRQQEHGVPNVSHGVREECFQCSTFYLTPLILEFRAVIPRTTEPKIHVISSAQWMAERLCLLERRRSNRSAIHCAEGGILKLTPLPKYMSHAHLCP